MLWRQKLSIDGKIFFAVGSKLRDWLTFEVSLKWPLQELQLYLKLFELSDRVCLLLMWSKYHLHHLLAWFLGWVWVAAQTCWFMASDLLSLTDRLKVQHHLSALMAALDVMFYSLNTGQYFSQRPLFVAVLINTLTSVTSKHSRASLCGFLAVCVWIMRVCWGSRQALGGKNGKICVWEKSRPAESL